MADEVNKIGDVEKPSESSKKKPKDKTKRVNRLFWVALAILIILLILSIVILCMRIHKFSDGKTGDDEIGLNIVANSDDNFELFAIEYKNSDGELIMKSNDGKPLIGPGARRKFLDTALCQLKPQYAEYLASYKKVLLHRNALLKDLYMSPQLYDVLDSFDDQLARYSAAVIAERLKYIDILSEYSSTIYSGISENKESISVLYSKSKEIDKNSSMNDIYIQELEKIKEARKEDVIYKSTSVGPHRDDIEILINNVSARSFGSQGQQRSCALALKLGESEIIKKVTGETPVALLDDVMSELDEKRQDYVLNHITDRQVFLTCCDPSQVLRLCGGKSFRIKGGEII